MTKEIWTLDELEEEISTGVDGKKLSKDEPRCQPFSLLRPCPSEEQTMLIACRDGDLDTVKRLAKEEPFTLIECDRGGLYPIHTSIINGHHHIANFLIDVQGSQINNLVDSYLHRPVHLATYCRATKLVKRLVEECGADLQDLSMRKTTNRVIHLAAMTGSIELMRYLVEEMPENLASPRPTVKDPNRWKESVIFSTLYEDRIDTFRYCLSRNPSAAEEEDEHGYPLFWSAVQWGAVNIVKFMKEASLDFNPSEKPVPSILFTAVRCGCLELVKYLKTTGVDIANAVDGEDTRESPLMWAIGHGNLEVAKYLIEHCGVSPNRETANGLTPLTAAVQEGYLELSKHLHAARDVKDPIEMQFSGSSTPRLSLLNMAARACRFDIMEWLLDSGICKVNFQDSCGYTALMGAAEEDHSLVLEFLVDRGADPLVSNANNEYFSSAFLIAVANGNISAMDTLFAIEPEVIFDVNFPNDPQWTCSCLHVALTQGHLEAAKWIVSHDPMRLELPSSSEDDDPEWPTDGLQSFQIVWPFKRTDGPDCEWQAITANPHIRSTIQELITIKEGKGNEDRLACLEWLIDLGVNMNQDLPDDDPIYRLNAGFTAVLEKNLNALKLVVEKGGVEVDIESSAGYSLLDLAASHGDLDIFKYVADKIREKQPEFDFDSAGSDNWSPLLHAMDKGRAKILEYLVSDCGVKIKKPILFETEEANGDDWDMAGEPNNGSQGQPTKKIKGDDETDRLFEMAAIGGSVEVWKFLESQLGFAYSSYEPYNHSRNPLRSALLEGNVLMVEHLVDEVKLELESYGNDHCLLSAITQNSKTDIVEFLYLHGISMNIELEYQFGSAILLAADRGNLDVVKWLHNIGIPLTLRDSQGRSCILTAAASGQIHILKWLLTQGISLQDRNPLTDETVWTVAEASAHQDILDFLEQKGFAGP